MYIFTQYRSSKSLTFNNFGSKIIESKVIAGKFMLLLGIVSYKYCLIYIGDSELASA